MRQRTLRAIIEDGIQRVIDEACGSDQNLAAAIEKAVNYRSKQRE